MQLGGDRLVGCLGEKRRSPTAVQHHTSVYLKFIWLPADEFSGHLVMLIFFDANQNFRAILGSNRLHLDNARARYAQSARQ